jgi:transketolase
VRNAFIKELTSFAKADESAVFLSANCGWGVLDGLAAELGEIGAKDRNGKSGRFLDVGIAEQNMIALAAGLAASGKRVFVYSIANFPTMRALEHIRNLILYPSLNVKIISIGAGFIYGAQGMTHHMTEDAGVMRSLPGIDIFTPCDPFEAAAIARICAASGKAAYIRIQRGGEAPLHSGELSGARIEAIANGTPIAVGEESPKASIAIIALGAIASEAIKAQESLAARGAIANVYSACRLPLNRVAIERIAKQADRIITLEEHNRVGALGSAVAEILADTQSAVKFDRLGLDDTFATIVGDQAYLRDAYRLNALATTKAIGACDFAKRDR